MYYEAGKSTSQYQNTSFIPMFTPIFSSTTARKAATALCGSNTQCLLDYAATGNAEMATATLTTMKMIESANSFLSKENICLFIFLQNDQSILSNAVAQA